MIKDSTKQTIKMVTKERGVAYIEGLLSVAVLLIVISGFWTIHTLHDFKRNIYSAAFNVLTNTEIKPFSTDSAGNFVLWGDPSAQGLDPILGDESLGYSSLQSKMVAQIKENSKISNFTDAISCKVAIGYLDLMRPGGPNNPLPAQWGECCDTTVSERIVHPITIESSTSQIDVTIREAANSYATKMRGRKINFLESLVLLDADTLPEFGQINKVDPKSIFMRWAPFLLWSCEGELRLIFGAVPFGSVRWSGVVVPKR